MLYMSIETSSFSYISNQLFQLEQVLLRLQKKKKVILRQFCTSAIYLVHVNMSCVPLKKKKIGKVLIFPCVVFSKFFITLESSISDSKTILYFSHLSGTCFHLLRLHDNFALKKN